MKRLFAEMVEARTNGVRTFGMSVGFVVGLAGFLIVRPGFRIGHSVFP